MNIFNQDNLILSSYLSLIVQIITGILGVDGLFYKLNDKDKILKDALKLETLVQLIEFIFYLYLVYNLYNPKILNNITSIRYFDWMITTPTMLISTIIYLKYQENKEKNKNDKLDFFKLIKENKNVIIKILISNWLMLLLGYLGETNTINPYLGVTIGFIFFSYTFNLLYCNYGVKSNNGLILYYFMYFIWSLYGVAAIFDFTTKNTIYNILDLFAKNFYGLFLYYLIIKSTKLELNRMKYY